MRTVILFTAALLLAGCTFIPKFERTSHSAVADASQVLAAIGTLDEAPKTRR